MENPPHEDLRAVHFNMELHSFRFTFSSPSILCFNMEHQQAQDQLPLLPQTWNSSTWLQFYPFLHMTILAFPQWMRAERRRNASYWPFLISVIKPFTFKTAEDHIRQGMVVLSSWRSHMRGSANITPSHGVHKELRISRVTSTTLVVVIILPWHLSSLFILFRNNQTSLKINLNESNDAVGVSDAPNNTNLPCTANIYITTLEQKKEKRAVKKRRGKDEYINERIKFHVILIGSHKDDVKVVVPFACVFEIAVLNQLINYNQYKVKIEW